MAGEENGDDGSIESAVAQIAEARAESAKPEPKIKPEAPEPAEVTATVEPSEEMPEVSTEEPDATPEDDSDTVQPTIAAPDGWTAEDKAWFDTLEPARQEAILRREKGTQAAESRRQNEHTTAIREATAKAQAAEQERQYFASVLQQYKNPLVLSFQQRFADVLRGEMDILRLSQDPQRWNEYQGYQAKFTQMGQQEQLLSQRAQEAERERLDAHVETRNAQLIEAMPDLKDPAKFQKFDERISDFLLGKGIPAERIRQAAFVDLEIAYDALRWRDAQKAKAAVPKPQPNAGQPQGNVRQMPRVMKPGMGNSSGAADDKIAAIDQRAQKSGSVDDAAARIRARLGRRA